MRDQNAAPLSTWVSALKKGNVKVKHFVFLLLLRDTTLEIIVDLQPEKQCF